MLIVRKLTRKIFPSFVCLLSIFAHVVKLLFIITPIAKQSYIMNEAPRTVAVATELFVDYHFPDSSLNNVKNNLPCLFAASGKHRLIAVCSPVNLLRRDMEKHVLIENSDLHFINFFIHRGQLEKQTKFNAFVI